jgi:hypothetical protein
MQVKSKRLVTRQNLILSKTFFVAQIATLLPGQSFVGSKDSPIESGVSARSAKVNPRVASALLKPVV